MKFSTVQCCYYVQCSIVQCSVVQCSVVQCSVCYSVVFGVGHCAVYISVQCAVFPTVHSAMKYSLVKHIAVMFRGVAGSVL